MDVPEMKQLSDLPSSLVTDILFRLPLETLLICRYVCKAWDGFFANPEFVEMQFAASPIHFLERRVKEDRAIHFGRVVKADGRLQAQTVDFTPRVLQLPDPTYRCVNSSNGLICLVGSLGSISVCNPLLGQSVSIPVPVRNYLGHKSVAIGFSAKDKLYKVLVGYQLTNRFGFEVYTLGTREWRAIDTDVDCRPWHHGGMDFNTFLHGSLHWISVGPSASGSRVRSLQSFNFETEKCERLALPYGAKNENLDVHVGIMNGCLYVCFCDTKMPTRAGIWVRKEYGVKNSWTCILTFWSFIGQIDFFWPTVCLEYGYNGFKPGDDVAYPILLCSFSNKDVLISYEEDLGKNLSIHVEKVLMVNDSGPFGDLFCYAGTKNNKPSVVEFNKRRSSHTYDFYHVTSYVPSFVSLQDVAKGEEVKVSRYSLLVSTMMTEHHQLNQHFVSPMKVSRKGRPPSKRKMSVFKQKLTKKKSAQTKKNSLIGTQESQFRLFEPSNSYQFETEESTFSNNLPNGEE